MTVVIFLVCGEIIMRVYFTNEHNSLFCFDDFLGWKFCNNKTGRVFMNEVNHLVSINSEGLRDFEKLNENKSNILFLGDSFTSNLEVKYPNKVFTEILEQKYLRDYNIINMGVNGYGTTQEYLILKEKGLKYNPKIVVLVFYPRNDFYDNLGVNDWIVGYKRPVFVYENNSLKLTKTSIKLNKNNSSFYNQVKRAVKQIKIIELLYSKFIRVLINLEIKSEDSKFEFASVPPEIKLSDVKDHKINEAYFLTCELLSRMNNELKEKEIKFYLVFAPTLFQVRNEYFEKLKELGLQDKDRFLPNKKIKECAKENGFEFIDPSNQFIIEENKHDHPYLYFSEGIHWTEKGNFLLAEILSSKLEESD